MFLPGLTINGHFNGMVMAVRP
ncbi:hypothetical protein CFSAN001992_02845 [Salmonella enterica subsp. enterica serovar Javiana str. CFSAN001992]|nr:hypothetical protein CFSAN001992_02845 [Salmonella enterica subsp. enterica serovar Javiana str. CFSAN001992]